MNQPSNRNAPVTEGLHAREAILHARFQRSYNDFTCLIRAASDPVQYIPQGVFIESLKALENNARWNESEILADFFAELGHLDLSA